MTHRLYRIHGLITASFILVASYAIAQTPPPMLPGEVLVKTQNGCGVIFDAEALKLAPAPYNDIEKKKKDTSESVWTGPCINGLAEGMGNIKKPADMDNPYAKTASEYFRGRSLGIKFAQTWTDKNIRNTITYVLDSGRSATIPDNANPFVPYWGDEKNGPFDGYTTYLKGPDGYSVVAQRSTCYLDLEKFRDCSSSNEYQVYAVALPRVGTWPDRGLTSWCPNPRSPLGCEALWSEKAAPVINSIKALMVEAENAIADKKQKYAEFSLPFEERESTKKLAREAEAKRQTALEAAAREREKEIAAKEQRDRDERDAQEAQKRADAELKAKAAAEKVFQANLTKLNVGALFTLADKLSTEGDNDKAREVRRTLVSRFPNHPLAAMAAQQMAANSAGTNAPATSSPAKNSTASSLAKAAKFASVCERNYKKLTDAMYVRKIASSSALYDLFIRDFNLDGAKIFEPCIGTSAEAARQYRRAMDEYNRINQYCAGPHDARLECTQWGASGGVSDNGGNPFNNPAWYAGWKADVNKALSDPNFSAELGSAAGAVTTVINEVERACEANLKVVENKFNAAQSNIPKYSVVVLSEATMWMITESIRVIESTCPNSERYRGQTAQFRQMLAQTKLVCDKSTSRAACVARLPEREPAAPPPAPPALKPLENKPPAVCEGGTGANFMKCEQEACGRMSGAFSTKGSCAACTFASGSWTHCAKGSGGVSSEQ